MPESLVVPGVEQRVVAGARHCDHMADEKRCNAEQNSLKGNTMGARLRERA